MDSPPAEVSHLFAYLSRMRFIRRWSLMHNTWPENVQEHSLRVAMIAHALALIRNRCFGGAVNADRVALLALFHDASEVLTGDLPSPIKYFNPNMRDAYQAIEAAAVDKLVSSAPQQLRDDYRALFIPDEEEADNMKLVKAADRLCAWIKCLEERAAGNPEFARAESTLEQAVLDGQSPEVDYFVRVFLPGFSLTLDEISAD